MPKPRISILDQKNFNYRNSAQTDVAETIRQARERLQAEEASKEFNQHRIVAIGRKKAS